MATLSHRDTHKGNVGRVDRDSAPVYTGLPAGRIALAGKEYGWPARVCLQEHVLHFVPAHNDSRCDGTAPHFEWQPPLDYSGVANVQIGKQPECLRRIARCL